MPRGERELPLTREQVTTVKSSLAFVAILPEPIPGHLAAWYSAPADTLQPPGAGTRHQRCHELRATRRERVKVNTL